jgi:hypothetical protein
MIASSALQLGESMQRPHAFAQRNPARIYAKVLGIITKETNFTVIIIGHGIQEEQEEKAKRA